MAWPLPHQVSYGDEGYHHTLTTHSKSACAAAPAVDFNLSLAPANGIISKEAGSDPWFPVQAATGSLILPVWKERI